MVWMGISEKRDVNSGLLMMSSTGLTLDLYLTVGERTSQLSFLVVSCLCILGFSDCIWFLLVGVLAS